MRRALCDTLPQKPGQSIELLESEAKHLTSVLRMRQGEEVELMDGKGFYARGTLQLQGKRTLVTATTAPMTNPALLAKPIHLSMAMIKNEAMEWVIEKAVELGVKTFTPVETEFTVVRTKSKGEDAFRERYQKIADQALKQCGRLERLEILAPISFEQLFLNKNHLIWLDESLAETSPAESHLSAFLSAYSPNTTPPRELELLVGPEGGFSAAEKARLSATLTGSKNGEITRVHVGSIVLRAETAALYGVSLLNARKSI